MSAQVMPGAGVQGAAAAGFIGFMVLMLLFFVVMIAALVFWIFMIIDCAKRNFKTEGEKVAWVIVVVIAGVLGAIIYYFAVKLPAKKK